MHIDYEDFNSGGMTIHNPPVRRLPFELYKLTPEFKQKQLAKPMYASRDPQKDELRVWDTKNGQVRQTRGWSMYRGACQDCGGVVHVFRNVSGPEFRGRQNRGWRGRYPSYCTGCRTTREEARRARHNGNARRRMRRLREEQYEVRSFELPYRGYETLPRQGVAGTAGGQPIPLGDETPQEQEDRESMKRENSPLVKMLNEQDAAWAAEDRARYRKSGPRSPYD